MAKTNQRDGMFNNVTTGTTKDWTVMLGQTSLSLTQNDSISTCRTPGFYSGVYCRITSNAASSPSTLVFVVNESATSQSTTVGAGATGEFEATPQISPVVLNDTMRGRLVNGGGGTIAMNVCGQMFSAASKTSAFCGGFNLGATGVSPTNFAQFAGNFFVATTETAQVQLRSRVAGTVRNGNCGITVNGRPDPTTYKNRINGANGTIVVTVGVGVTGQVFDDVHSDAVAIGDLINRTSTGGAGTGTCNGLFGVTLETLDSSMLSHLGVNTSGGLSFAAGSTNYVPFNGGSNTNLVVATESTAQAKAGAPQTVSQYELYVDSNGVSNASTFRFRKNAGNGNGVITIGIGVTGWVDDGGAQSDVCVATDEINWSMVTGAGGTPLVVLMVSSRVQYFHGSLFRPATLVHGSGGPFFANPLAA